MLPGPCLRGFQREFGAAGLGPNYQSFLGLHTHIYQSLRKRCGYFQGYLYEPVDSLTEPLHRQGEKHS